MKNKALVPALILLSIFCFSTPIDANIGGDQESKTDIGPEEMVLKTQAAIKSARFPHRKHQEKFTCGQCHHSKNVDGIKIPYTEGMSIQKCVACHNKEKMITTKLNNFKLVAHSLCKECHKKNRGAAPTRCSGCHIK